MPPPPPKPFRYRLNQRLRSVIHYLVCLFAKPQNQQRLNLANQEIKKILLVRATFRMGDSLIPIPAILSFRKHFPDAKIDFLCAPIIADFLKDLPLTNIFTITRRYPGSALHYPLLMHRLRSTGYDVAVDLSCSQSAMGAFLVGFSSARLRIGLKGKWDRWFNVTVNKMSVTNKYKILPAYLASIGLNYDFRPPFLLLADHELATGRNAVRSLIKPEAGRAIVGVFVGGRKSWGKRWPVKHFCDVINGLISRGLRVIVFTGPEERDLLDSLLANSKSDVPIIFEPVLKKFAALVSNCDLFVTCDSGPMHLAYALGVPTVAIFNYPNFDRWAPPADFVRVAYESTGCSATEVLRICSEALALRDSAAGRKSAMGWPSSLHGGTEAPKDD